MRHGPAVVALVMILAAARPCLPCLCFPHRSFDEVARTADRAFVGTVRANKAGFLEVDVAEALKGAGTPSRIRVWDASFGTSCGALLEAFTPGTRVWIAAATMTQGVQDDWSPRLPPPEPGDLFISGMCGESVKFAGTREEAADLKQALQ